MMARFQLHQIGFESSFSGDPPPERRFYAVAWLTVLLDFGKLNTFHACETPPDIDCPVFVRRRSHI